MRAQFGRLINPLCKKSHLTGADYDNFKWRGEEQELAAGIGLGLTIRGQQMAKPRL